MVAQFRSQFTKELGEGAEPPPVGEAPWNRFLDLLQPSSPLGTAFSTSSGCRRPLELLLGPSPAGNAPWKWFQTSAHAAQPLGGGFKPHFRASRPFGSGSKPISRLPGALEAVPRLFPGCATPHARSLAVPPPPPARIFAVATNIFIS